MAFPSLIRGGRGMEKHAFLSDYEQRLSTTFVEQGYVIVDVDDINTLNRIQLRTASLAAEYLNHPPHPM